jgi:trimethylamine--corrinoid protein Co-methyltransferase
MRANYVYFGSPQFRILSDRQIEEIHSATLQIMAKTGVAFDTCPHALEILGEGGADVTDPKRVKIPAHLVEKALKTAPKENWPSASGTESLAGFSAREVHYLLVALLESY